MVEKYRMPTDLLDDTAAETSESAPADQREKPQEQPEVTAKINNREVDVDGARNEALELALEAEKPEQKKEELSRKQPERPLDAEKRHRPSKSDLNTSFKKSMKQVRQEMSPAERTFSKIIHNPTVEKVSSALSATIARPNLVIAGGLGTLIFGALVYLTARNYGYVLSGFEAIGTFILGWCIGAIIEFVRVGFINTKRQ